MKKEKGISLITLIITIIVIIILAAIVIFTGLRTPDSANFAKFTMDVDNVQMAVNNKYADLKTKHAIAKESRTDEQIYIEIATGVDPDQYASMNTTSVNDNTTENKIVDGSGIQNILPQYSNVADGTQIDGKTITGSIGMTLPKVREFNNAWYVTKEGKVFNANGYAYNNNTYFDAKTYYGEELGSNSTKNANRAKEIYESAISKEIILAGNVPTVGTDTANGEAGGNGGSGGNETQETHTAVYATVCTNGTLLFSKDQIAIDAYLSESETEIASGYSIENLTDTVFYMGNSPADSSLPRWFQDTSVTSVIFLNKIAPKNTAAWFVYLTNITTIQNLSNLDTSNVTDMTGMFAGCSKLASLNLSNFNTENVTNMKGMFMECSALTSLDLSSFNTENVTDFSSMFVECSELKTIYVSNNFVVSKHTNTHAAIFHGDYSLIGQNGTAYADEGRDGIALAHVDTNLTPGYFTAK